MIRKNRIRIRILPIVLLSLVVAGCQPSAHLVPVTETPAVETAPENDGPCETHTAEMALSVTPETIRAGETVTVEVVLRNTGCLALGLPQYRLVVEGGEGVLADLPEPVVHSLAVAPGGSDNTVFPLDAVSAGEVQLRATASFEVHVGHPGPAYWGSAATGEPVTLTIMP